MSACQDIVPSNSQYGLSGSIAGRELWVGKLGSLRERVRQSRYAPRKSNAQATQTERKHGLVLSAGLETRAIVARAKGRPGAVQLVSN